MRTEQDITLTGVPNSMVDTSKVPAQLFYSYHSKFCLCKHIFICNYSYVIYVYIFADIPTYNNLYMHNFFIIYNMCLSPHIRLIKYFVHTNKPSDKFEISLKLPKTRPKLGE